MLALSLWGTGGSGGTLGITAPLLTAAGRHVIFLLAGLIALAGLLSLFAPRARAHPETPAGASLLVEPAEQCTQEDRRDARRPAE